jgi:hypothetical protein
MPMPEIPEDWEWIVHIRSDEVVLTLYDNSGQNDSIQEVRLAVNPTPLALQQMAEEILRRKKTGEQLSKHLGIEVRVQ